MAEKHSLTDYVSNSFYDEFYNAIEKYLIENKEIIGLSLNKVRNIETLELSDAI